MTYRIAICDDEQTQIEYLASIVSKWSKETEYINSVIYGNNYYASSRKSFTVKLRRGIPVCI